MSLGAFSSIIQTEIWTHRFDGLQQLDTVFLNAAVSISKLHESLAGCSLRFPNPDDGENISKRWKYTRSNSSQINQELNLWHIQIY